MAQNVPETGYTFKNSLKVSVTQFFASEYRLTYERYFKNHGISLAISPGYVLNKKPSIWLNQNRFSELSGYGAKLTLKKHWFNSDSPIVANRRATSIIDLYTAPYFQYFNFRYREDQIEFLTEGFDNNLYSRSDQYNDIINAFESGILAGVEIAVHQRFMVDLFGGAGFRYADIVSNPVHGTRIGVGSWSRGYTGLVPRIGVNLGFSF
jgi:hypothetical protein